MFAPRSVKYRSIVMGFVLFASTTMPADISAATVESVRHGPWSSPSTWNAGIPRAGDDVWIRAGHIVDYDHNSTEVMHSIVINGHLRFDHDRTTRLEVGVIVITNSESSNIADPCSGGHSSLLPITPTLTVGTAQDPIRRPHQALIRLHEVSGFDPACAPAIISHAGRMEFHGAPLQHTWVELSATAPGDTTELSIDSAVDWIVGDKVIITSTLSPPGRSPGATILNGGIATEAEERIIEAVSADGLTLTVAPLAFEHLGVPLGALGGGEVANLSRNVVVESADPDGVRGHTMYHRGSVGGVSYAEFRHLGKAGVLGRYPIHFHLVRDSMRGSSVVGASVWDSKNRWVTLHGTEFVAVRDTVGYGSWGHGFFLEDATETNNLFDGNLGTHAYITAPIPGQALQWDPNDGACYWAANARNFLFDNVFAECGNDSSVSIWYAPSDESMVDDVLLPDGSRGSVDIRQLSGGLVRGLEVHSQHGWGPWIRRSDFPLDDPMQFENIDVWNTHYSIDISGGGVVFDGVRIANTPYGFYNNYPGPHLLRNINLESINPHGGFMTYRGGGGTFLYENITVDSSGLVFRMTAKSESGGAGEPIIVHARNVSLVDPRSSAAWIGSEGDNVRAAPLLMQVHHDFFGPDQDAVFLPEAQSSDQAGVPTLDFVDANGVLDADGVLLEGRGDYQYAVGDIAWPDSPMAAPIDSLPPATMVLHPSADSMAALDGSKVTICGVSIDQRGIESVSVNGRIATLAANGRDWCASINGVSSGPLQLTARATDINGNVELYPHVLTVNAIALDGLFVDGFE